MGQQLYQRLPRAFVEEILEAFNDRRMTERQACALLGLKRAVCMSCGGSGSVTGRPGRLQRPTGRDAVGPQL